MAKIETKVFLPLKNEEFTSTDQTSLKESINIEVNDQGKIESLKTHEIVHTENSPMDGFYIDKNDVVTPIRGDVGKIYTDKPQFVVNLNETVIANLQDDSNTSFTRYLYNNTVNEVKYIQHTFPVSLTSSGIFAEGSPLTTGEFDFDKEYIYAKAQSGTLKTTGHIIIYTVFKKGSRLLTKSITFDSGAKSGFPEIKYADYTDDTIYLFGSLKSNGAAPYTRNIPILFKIDRKSGAFIKEFVWETAVDANTVAEGFWHKYSDHNYFYLNSDGVNNTYYNYLNGDTPNASSGDTQQLAKDSNLAGTFYTNTDHEIDGLTCESDSLFRTATSGAILKPDGFSSTPASSGSYRGISLRLKGGVYTPILLIGTQGFDHIFLNRHSYSDIDYCDNNENLSLSAFDGGAKTATDSSGTHPPVGSKIIFYDATGTEYSYPAEILTDTGGGGFTFDWLPSGLIDKGIVPDFYRVANRFSVQDYTKFSIGDRVRFVDTRGTFATPNYADREYIGYIYTITDVQNSYIEVSLDNDDLYFFDNAEHFTGSKGSLKVGIISQDKDLSNIEEILCFSSDVFNDETDLFSDLYFVGKTKIESGVDYYTFPVPSVSANLGDSFLVQTGISQSDFSNSSLNSRYMVFFNNEIYVAGNYDRLNERTLNAILKKVKTSLPSSSSTTIAHEKDRVITGLAVASQRMFLFTEDVTYLVGSQIERPFHGYGTNNFNAIASDGIGVWFINSRGVFRVDYNSVQMISRNIYDEPMFPNHTDQELKEISAAIDSELRWYIISDPKDKRFYIFNIDTLKPTKGSLEFTEFDYSHPKKLMSFNGKAYGILDLSKTYTSINPPSSTTYNEYSVVKLFNADVSDSLKESGFQYLQNVEYSNRLTKTLEINEIRKSNSRHKFARYIEFYYKCDQVVTITVYKRTDDGKSIIGAPFDLPVSATFSRKKARIDSMIGYGFTLKVVTAGDINLERIAYVD